MYQTISKFFISGGLLLCGGLVSLAQGAQPLLVTVKITNHTEEVFYLTSADWDLGDETPEDFTIPARVAGVLQIELANPEKDQATFRYSSGGKACKFNVGHGIKESFGWLSPTKTPIQWAKGVSEGSFKATCNAKLVSYDPGKGYTVRLGIR